MALTLEQQLTALTDALHRTADLLEISNAARGELIEAQGGTKPAASTTTSSDTDMTVADIKEAIVGANLETLKQMLSDETEGKARTSALKAIEAAIEAAGDSGNESTDTKAADTSEASTEETSTSTAPAANDKNAQPVPAGVTGEQAAGAFGAWFGETDDETERAARRAFVGSIVSTLGVKIGELDEAGRRKAIFYLRRKRAGMEVPFDVEFDFDGSPTQDVPEAASEEPAANPDDDLL